MKKAKILISRQKGAYRIKVQGRASLDCSAPLRNIVRNIGPEAIHEVAIDLGDCTGMDSTFMGMLAMIALRVKQVGSLVEIRNCNATNKHLLNGLGLKNLFNYRDQSMETTAGDDSEWEDASEDLTPRKELAETVLDAHETLMKADKANVEKFEKVVDFVKKDLAEKDNEK